MTAISGPEETGDLPPTATSCSMPHQREPSTENVPGGYLSTTPGHPSPTGTTLHQDQETMPPQPPRPPQRRNMDPFEDAELRAGLRHPRHHTLEQAGGSPPGTPPGRQTEQALRCGPPAARRNNRELCAATTGALRPRDADRGRPCWREDLVVQPQPTGPGRRMSPTTWLGAHADSATDRPQARAQHRGPGTGRPATQSQHPQNPTVQKPGGMGKQDSPRQGTQPQEHGGAVPTRSGDGTRRAPTTQRRPQQRRHDRAERTPLLRGADHPAPEGVPLEPGSRRLHDPGERSPARQPHPPAQGPAPRPPDGYRAGGGGTWHPSHALYCLWQWVQRRWQHTRDWTAAWRFHLDGRQQL